MKIKMKNYMLIGTALLALLATSCKDMLGFDSDSGSSSQTGKALETAENINAVAFLSVSLDSITAKAASSSARTALPDFETATGTNGTYQYAGFTKFVLYGAKAGSDAAAIGNSEESPIRVWESHGDTTAYRAFTAEGASKVPIALSSGEAEEWNFTLVGYYGTDEKHITFAGSVSKTIKPTVDGFERVEVTQDTFASLVVGLYTKDAANGVFVKLDGNAEFDDSKEYYIYTDSNTPTNPTNGLDFTLARTSKFVYPYSTSGEGKIEITLNYATGSELSGYKTIAKLYSATVSESVVTKSETPLTVEGNSVLATEAADNATERLYSAEGIKEGMYVAVFEFTENGVEVGAMTEYVYVLKDLTSKSTLTVDLNGSYAITYRYWILDDEANQNVVVTSAVQDRNGKYTFGLGARTDSGFPGVANTSEGNMFAEITSEADNTISANAGGVVMTYSRLTGATLPTANLFSEDFNSTNPESEYLFCGWYDITGSEAADNNTIAGLINDSENHTPVLEIKKNTFVHDKTYIAKFVKRVEMPVIDKVTITPETDAASNESLNNGYKVGYMLTATPSYGETPTAFTGTATWQWYWSADSENYSFDDEDTVSGTNATIAARDETHVSTYRVEPSKAGKYLQARVVQKYKIVPEKIEGAIAYYKVTENAAVVSGVAKKDVESVPTPVAMVLGTLQAVGSTNPEDEDALFKMHYGTAATAEVVEIGTQLSASNLHVTSGVITDAHNPAWEYQHGTGNSATVSAYALSLTDEINDDHVYAPVGSNYVAVTVSVAGYEPLHLPNIVDSGAPKSAFVSVKYKTPTEANVKSTLWCDDGNAENQNELEGIDKGYIVFKATEYSSSENDYTNGETPIDVTAIPLSYKVGDGDFTPVTARAALGKEHNDTADILAGTVSFKAAEKKVNGEGEPADTQYTDANGNPVGHIAESSDALSYAFSTDNSLAYIGTRQLISYIEVARDGETDVPHPNNQPYTAKVGHTLTVKAYDEHDQEIARYGAEGLSGITWTWATADTESTNGKTATAANTTYTIKQADYTSGTEETHTLTITASRIYAYSTLCEKTLTVSIDKGTMALNGPIINFERKAGHENDKFTVNTTKEALAAALQLRITSGGLKDSISEAVVTGVITEFDGTLIDKGSGTAWAKVKFTAPGYEGLIPTDPVYVTGIPLQAAIPAGVEASIKLSDAKDNISYGYIQFATYADGNNGNILGAASSSSGYYTYEMEYTTDDPYTSNSVTWYDITPDEFAIPAGFPTTGDTPAKIWVRLKQKGFVGSGVDRATYYYSASTGEWKTNALVPVPVTEDQPDQDSSYAASDPIEVTYKNSEHGGTRGIASGTKVTFTAVDVEKLEVSKEAGIITIKPAEDWTASSWFVDGRKITSNSNPIRITADGKQLIIDTTNVQLLGGTYQITAFVTTTNSSKGISEVIYSAGASVTVSK
ncbi:hypothetical protein [uncultured Treponema sp.]|uniref:hypothetical protein n=1 Tax=uncultured Treponema sp. TaxID=162155 RepID=UPI0025E83D70|nr:hypothetical protein [uncultured Treponema sp.]